MASSPTVYDALVIGSGQAGTPLARALALSGLKTALVDRAHLGGTCVNEGCTPTKTMVASGRVAHLARRGADYGVETDDKLRINMETVRRRKRDIVTQFNGGSERRVREAGVDVLMGHATFTGPKTLGVRMNDGAGGVREITATGPIFLNVGERPARPSLAGLDGVPADRVLDSTSVMELGAVPDHLVVLGGGYVGLEFAQLFRRLGADVTVVQRAAQLLPREDADVAAELKKILEDDGVTVLTDTAAVSVTAGSAGATMTGVDDAAFELSVRPRGAPTATAAAVGATVVRGTHLLVAAGRVPNTDTLGLAAAGIKTDAKGYVVVDGSLATSAPDVYCLGDAHPGPAFTHMSYDDFRIARQLFAPSQQPARHPAMATTSASTSRRLVPYVVYTDPQLAHVGLHESDLAALEREGGRKVKRAKMPMSYVARALETDETRGLMKASVDAETGEILGFTCLGLDGGEVMAVVQAAMMGGLKYWDLEAAVWAHPSLAEALNNLWGFLE